MKILLDECLPRRLASEFKGHEVTTVPQKGWSGIKNGELLSRMGSDFDLFITVDRNLSFQQNLKEFPVAVIILAAPSNRYSDLKPLMPKVLQELPRIRVGQVLRISAED